MRLVITYLLITVLAIDCWMRIPYPAETGFIKMGNASIYFERGGGIGPAKEPVILLHAGFWMPICGSNRCRSSQSIFPL